MQFGFKVTMYSVLIDLSAIVDPAAALSGVITMADKTAVSVSVAASGGRTAAELATAVATAVPAAYGAYVSGTDVKFSTVGMITPAATGLTVTATAGQTFDNTATIGVAGVAGALIARAL